MVTDLSRGHLLITLVRHEVVVCRKNEILQNDEHNFILVCYHMIVSTIKGIYSTSDVIKMICLNQGCLDMLGGYRQHCCFPTVKLLLWVEFYYLKK